MLYIQALGPLCLQGIKNCLVIHSFVHLLPTREYEGRTIGMLLHTDFRAVLTGTSLLQCLGHMGAWGLLGWNQSEGGERKRSFSRAVSPITHRWRKGGGQGRKEVKVGVFCFSKHPENNLNVLCHVSGEWCLLLLLRWSIIWMSKKCPQGPALAHCSYV